MYKYKNLKTGKIVNRKKPIAKKDRRNYQLLEWRRNMQMRGSQIKQK